MASTAVCPTLSCTEGRVASPESGAVRPTLDPTGTPVAGTKE